MEKYIINGKEIQWDTFDIGNMELFDSEVKRVKTEVEKIKMEQVTEENYLAILKEQCEIIVDFFACVLGEDMQEIIFQNKLNIKEIIEAYGKFTQEVTANRQSLGNLFNLHKNKEKENFAAKAPAVMNREQRRRKEREDRRQEAIRKAKKKAQEQK